MFGLRRAALRLISSPPTTSLRSVSSPRTLSTFTSIPLRQSRLTLLGQCQHRFVSDVPKTDAEREIEEVDAQTPPVVDAEQDAAAVASAAAEASDTGVAAHARLAQESHAAPTQIQPDLANDIDNWKDGVRPSAVLYVGNLNFDVTQEDIDREFSRFGNIERVSLMHDDRGLSKGFAYLTYRRQEDATVALQQMDTSIFEGRPLVVQYTRHERIRNTQHNKFLPDRKPVYDGPPTKSLYIGNMSFDMNDEDLNDLFRSLDNIIDVRVAIDRSTGKPRGFAHADFIDVASCEQARKALSNKIVRGRPLRCTFALGGTQKRRPN